MNRLFAALLPVLFLPFLTGCEEDQCIAPCGLLPAIVYNNQIYTNTGEELPIKVEESEIVGRITSTVSGVNGRASKGKQISMHLIQNALLIALYVLYYYRFMLA